MDVEDEELISSDTDNDGMDLEMDVNMDLEVVISDMLDKLEEKIKESTEFLAKIMDLFLFDFQIVCHGITFPCHKYVLSARSEILSKDLLVGIHELSTLNVLLIFHISPLV